MVQGALALRLAALVSLVATRGVVAAEVAVAAGVTLLMASGVALVLVEQHDDNQV